MKLCVITDGLIRQGGKLQLHPALQPWQSVWERSRQQWWRSDAHNPLSVYAAWLGCEPAALLAAAPLPKHSAQYWVASPYHARMGRDTLRVMPESMLPWCVEDAQWVCALLNPLLQEDGMQLHAVGAALLLSCEQALNVMPQAFPELDGGQLPNTHPAGADGGRLMRLLSEIQMMLHQSPAAHRRMRGEPDIHGLWLWGATSSVEQLDANINIATRNPYLHSLVDAQDAQWIVSESDRLAELVRSRDALPSTVCLMGEGYAVSLKKSLWSRWRSQDWQPKGELKHIDYRQLFPII